tara:strand:- start:559 stop:732 length:174 start_codon:yes stop_codon:yes gene_type:complete
VGKGSKRRPTFISEKEFQDAWDNIFTRKKTPPHAATKKHQDKTKLIPRHYKYNNIEE